MHWWTTGKILITVEAFVTFIKCIPVKLLFCGKTNYRCMYQEVLLHQGYVNQWSLNLSWESQSYKLF